MAIGFIDNDKNNCDSLIVDVTFTNAICYGQTGSGKTTGFILPNIENRIKLNHGVLLYDFKGNLHEQVKSISRKYNKLDMVYEIGKPWGEKIDILKNTSEKSLENMFFSISTRNEYDDYWAQSAYNLFSNIYFMLKNITDFLNVTDTLDKQIFKNIRILDSEMWLQYSQINREKYNPTFKNIYNRVNCVRSILKLFFDVKKVLYVIDNLFYYFSVYGIEFINKDMLNQLYNKKIAFEQRYNSLGEYQSLKDEGESSGKYGVIYHLNSTLQSIGLKDSFSNDQFDIVDALQKSSIVIINVEDFNEQMLNFLNFSIYNRLTKNTLISQKYSPVTVFIDEAQKVLSEKSIPDVDICRENNFEFILATQDKSLLQNKIGTLATYLLLRNVTSQYSFQTVEPQETKFNTALLNKFECVDMLKNIKYKIKPMFIGHKELFYSEYFYQLSKKVSRFVNIKSNKKYILKHSSYMSNEDKIIVCYEDGKICEENLVYDSYELDNYITEIVRKRVSKNA